MVIYCLFLLCRLKDLNMRMENYLWLKFHHHWSLLYDIVVGHLFVLVLAEILQVKRKNEYCLSAEHPIWPLLMLRLALAQLSMILIRTLLKKIIYLRLLMTKCWLMTLVILRNNWLQFICTTLHMNVLRMQQ